MAILPTEAVDEMFSSVKAAVDASQSIIGYAPEMRWPGAAKGSKPDMTSFWLRTSLQIVTEDQSSLANDFGSRMYESVGLLFVQLFCPRNLPGSIDKGRLLAERIKSVFRQQSISGEVWYKNPKVVPLPETDQSYPFNVVITFSFRTLRTNGEDIGLPTSQKEKLLLENGTAIFMEDGTTPIIEEVQ